LGQLFPPGQQPTLAVGMGSEGDRRLGVYISTANEMLESPLLFTQPQSRTFLAALTELLSRQGDTRHAALARNLAHRFLVMNSPDELRAAGADFGMVSQDFGPSLPRSRVPAFAYGLLAAQIAYNAAFLRQRDQLGQQLGVLGTVTMGENGDANLAAKRQALQGANPNDLHAVNAAASALTLAIMEPRR